MPHYVSLLNWTDQGIKQAKDTVSRLKAARQAMQAAGVRLVSVYYTVGQYDLVTVVDAPDDETASAVLLGIGMQGNIRSVSMRAFTEEEMGRVVGKLP